MGTTYKEITKEDGKAYLEVSIIPDFPEVHHISKEKLLAQKAEIEALLAKFK